MSSEELFYSCRTGDLESLRNLVEETEVELNVRDQWDSTPLYYACLCGHENLVEFLLAKGARCEPHTFDGERCIYAALTNRIRKLLKEYKAITPDCMRRDSYREFFRRCLQVQDFVDVCFIVHGVKIHAHQVILSARSSYFADMFQTKWKGRSVIRLNHPLVAPWAFQSILQYLYTDRLCVEVSRSEECILLAKQCKLIKLKETLESRLSMIESFGLSKPGTKAIKVINVEPDSTSEEFQESYSALVEAVVPLPFRLKQFPSGIFCDSPVEEIEVFLPFMENWPYDDVTLPDDKPPFTDICFVVEEFRFYAHKVFMCGRSDYFKALLHDHFSEAVLPEGCTPEVTLHDVNAEVFATVVAFIYRDSAEITMETAFNVLCAADLYLLNGLKRICANQISKYLDVDNVISILRTARLFSLESLESNCSSFLACHLDKVIESVELHSLILEDAASIQNRQEKDSIPIIDDIRFHLYNNVLPNSYSEESIMDSEKKLSILNELLESLGLE
ncbi:ankyrin repeat and BTB/POZ domain-containing protein 1-like, partial [Actinia tenebrosa]|uniref:Ankyrin repeat and BTB/POZ domain-containing protein 1-like n=1 Tax=Actinia tenebrosa TaxID=6105 RepID=A0A6P8IZC3_ACTTE